MEARYWSIELVDRVIQETPPDSSKTCIRHHLFMHKSSSKSSVKFAYHSFKAVKLKYGSQFTMILQYIPHETWINIGILPEDLTPIEEVYFPCFCTYFLKLIHLGIENSLKKLSKLLSSVKPFRILSSGIFYSNALYMTLKLTARSRRRRGCPP